MPPHVLLLLPFHTAHITSRTEQCLEIQHNGLKGMTDGRCSGCRWAGGRNYLEGRAGRYQQNSNRVRQCKVRSFERYHCVGCGVPRNTHNDVRRAYQTQRSNLLSTNKEGSVIGSPLTGKLSTEGVLLVFSRAIFADHRRYRSAMQEIAAVQCAQ